MDESKKYRNPNNTPPGDGEFFSTGEFRWNKSREIVWDELSTRLGSQNQSRSLRIPFAQLAFAAGFLLIIGLVFFLRYHSLSFSTGSLVQQTIDLPDASSVEMNANSKLIYYPYWWKIQRILVFEGEGFFEVEKGNKFTVRTGQGNVEVLGTRFNIFSHKDVLKVACLSGSVKVVSASKNKEVAVIRKNSTAQLKRSGDITLKKEANTATDVAWRTGNFYFTADAVQDVFSRVEQQYGVIIQADLDSSFTYTGNFRIEQNVETVLGYVCPALGLTYKQVSPGKYLIVKDDE